MADYSNFLRRVCSILAQPLTIPAVISVIPPNITTDAKLVSYIVSGRLVRGDFGSLNKAEEIGDWKIRMPTSAQPTLVQTI